MADKNEEIIDSPAGWVAKHIRTYVESGGTEGQKYAGRDLLLLTTRGRKSGKLYSAPVYLLVIDDRRYLVCPRGRSQWVRNAETVGRVILKRGSAQDEFKVRAVPDTEKPEILKTYLERFKTIVQRYFPVPAGSPASAFAEYVGRYPVFELMISDRQNGAAT